MVIETSRFAGDCSAELDFTAAVFEAEQITLDIDMIGGSVELRVPEDMRVRSTLATTHAGRQDDRKHPPETTGRSLTINGRAVWGSVAARPFPNRHRPALTTVIDGAGRRAR